MAREIVSRTVESRAGRRSEINVVSARTSVGCSRSRTWRSSSAESCGCNSRSRLSRNCVSTSSQSTAGLTIAGAGAGAGGSAGANTGGATDATEPNKVDGGGAGRGAKVAASVTVGGGGGTDVGGATTGGGGCGSEMSRSSEGKVSRSVSTGIVASSGITFPPGCVSRSRSVALRELVAIFHFDCGRLESALTIALEARARTPAVFVIARHDFDHSFKARKEIFAIGRDFVIERQQNVAVGC